MFANDASVGSKAVSVARDWRQQVLSADLSNGLLSVDLVRPEPERIIRKIDISARD